MIFSPHTDSVGKFATISPARDLSDSVRYLAALKNIRLIPEQVSGAVTWVEQCLSGPHTQLFDLDNEPTVDPATKFIDRILDVIAAADVLHHVAVFIDGKPAVNSEAIIRRAGEAVNQFTGGASFFRWPDPMETLRLHYSDVPWAPITLRADDGTVTTTYLRHGVLHRDPMQGPACHRIGHSGESQQYWMEGKLHRPHEQGPALINMTFEGGGTLYHEFRENGVLHRPSNVGPAVIHTVGGKTAMEAYVENGIAHRDPEHGPAYRDLRKDGERAEYIVGGALHRDWREGPALTYTNFEGQDVSGEEYFRHGEWHRPGSEGPAVVHTDATGRRVLEIFVENGVRHRDPAEGPAWRRVEDGIESVEYVVRGEIQYDEACDLETCDGDESAVIHQDADGTRVQNECLLDDEGLPHE